MLNVVSIHWWLLALTPNKSHMSVLVLLGEDELDISAAERSDFYGYTPILLVHVTNAVFCIRIAGGPLCRHMQNPMRDLRIDTQFSCQFRSSTTAVDYQFGGSGTDRELG